ncbi:hypothetical protein [Pseudofrankia sp. BMG5.37]|uniref:hypothetical protein n=1 Tax=Pseudofrankia sp. BMG5.37 TaxID=3050035 RepID=UPI002893DF82|nr:hypothetical protein [Pseudofrankia sp. BMG5.37]MDT3445127.1 hypothetical protein [Pseudofrankia sp. BMG5.37]
MRTWYAGIGTCLPYLATHVMGSPGHWRMFPTRANGQPASVVYYRDGRPVPAVRGSSCSPRGVGGVTAITAFGDPGLVTAFGFPASVPARAGAGDRVRIRD